MKRLMKAMGFCVLLLLSLPACTSKPSEQAASPKVEPAAPPPAVAPTASETEAPASAPEDQTLTEAIARPYTGDLDGMIERRVIRVLTTYSKTNFFLDKGAQLGLVPDAMRLFEADLNKKLKSKHLRVQVMILPVAHDELIPALLAGRGDIVAAGTMITDPRKEQVDFTNPTRTGVAAIVVTGPGAPPVATVDDLAGKDVYLRASMVTAPGVARFNADLAKKGLPPVKILPAPEVFADEDILEMVNAGLVKTTITFDYIAEFWKQIFPNIILNKDAAVKTDGQIAMMVRKNSPQLKAELNAFLARYPEGSTTRNVLLQKYLKNVKYAKAATSKAEMGKVERTVGLFRKYGEQYSMDFLLMMAQGYQESQLDQNAKSHVGAIGVMQVMPATGKELNVGDIRQLEANIHAGVKYIRFMIDRYYADEPMDRVDKELFAFASYNAGPARINQLRQRAAKRGLDPNKWFNNVEVLASESIGRETVQYVSNIYKYYVAYQLVMDDRELREKAKEEVAGKP